MMLVACVGTGDGVWCAVVVMWCGMWCGALVMLVWYVLVLLVVLQGWCWWYGTLWWLCMAGGGCLAVGCRVGHRIMVPHVIPW